MRQVDEIYILKITFQNKEIVEAIDKMKRS